MKFDFKNKQTLIAIVVVLLFLVGGWWFFMGQGNDSQSATVEMASDPIENILGRELLVSLEKMKTVKLDYTFLSNNLFKNLNDFTVTIPNQPVGRRDPFASLSQD
jgi:hypothetical protein